MKRIIVLISFIPWLLFFYSLTKYNYNIIGKKNMKNKFIKLFPIYDLILYAVFIYFSLVYRQATSIFFVRVILFSSIFLYLFFNKISRKDYKNNKNISNKFVLYIILVSILPIIIYFFKGYYSILCYSLIGMAVLNALIVYIGKKITNEK